MNAKQSVLNKIKNGDFALKTDEQIAAALRLGKKEGYALRDMLRELVRDGEILTDSRHRYGTAEQFGALKGKISGNERGFGFFMPEDKALSDLFIPHRALHGALHGDTVYCIPVKGRMSDDEGEVLAVLERGLSEIVGTFRREKKAGYLHPDERKYAEDVYIPLAKSMNCPDGAKAVATVLRYPEGRAPEGEITEILGEGGDFFRATGHDDIHTGVPPLCCGQGSAVPWAHNNIPKTQCQHTKCALVTKMC